MRKQVFKQKSKPICRLLLRYTITSALLFAFTVNSGVSLAEQVFAEELLTETEVVSDAVFSDMQAKTIHIDPSELSDDTYTDEKANTLIDEDEHIAEKAVSVSDVEITVARNGIDSLRLSWNGAENVDYYELYRMIDDGTWKKVKNVTGTTTINLNLASGHLYSYRIREKLSDGTFGNFSAESSYLLENTLKVPANFTVKKQGSSSAYLFWDTVDGAEQYVIYRSVNNGAWTKLKTVDNSFAVNYGLSNSSEYAFKIYAYSNEEGVNYSDFTNPVEFSLSDEIRPPVVSVIQYGLNTAVIKWEALDNAVLYNVYRSENGGVWRKIKSSSGTCAYNYSLKEGTAYSYKVNAVCDINGQSKTSEFSNEADFCLGSDIGNPQGFRVSRVSNTCSEIFWEPLAGAEGYALYRSDDGNIWKKLKEVEGDSARNYSLTLGSVYLYSMRGYRNGEFGRYYGPSCDAVSYWNSGKITISLSNSGGNNVVSWNTVAGADYYNVYIDDQLYSSDSGTQIEFAADDSGEVTVTACKEYGQELLETNKSNSVKLERIAAVNYRALLIGETSYTTKLNGPDNDVSAMENILNGLGMGFEVYSQIDASKQEIIDLITIAFSDATENDISLFYYSGHGVTGSGDYYSGAIQTVDYQYITTEELAKLLSAVPGRVIVIMDSCGSGATISDEEIAVKDSVLSTASDGETVSEKSENMVDDVFDAKQFSEGVVNAFGSYYINTSESDSGKSGLLRSMEFRTSKFYVLTGSAYEESSLTTNSGGVWGGLLTKGIASCCGFVYPTSTFGGSLVGDSNGDNKLSLCECDIYCNSYVNGRQHVLNYPSDSDFTIFFIGGDY